MKSDRKTISLLVGAVNTYFSQKLIIGFEDEVKKQDVNALYFLGVQNEYLYESVLNIKGTQSYDYHFNTIYDYSALSGTDGFVINYGTIGVYLKHDNLLDFLSKYDNKPIVLVTDSVDNSKYSSVVADNYQGMYDIVSHLFEEHNCKKILHVSGPNGNMDSKERLQGYLDACKNHGLIVDDKMVVEGDYSEYVYDQVEKLLDDNKDVDAITFANDEMSFAGYKVCKKRGIKVGKDIMLTGFDDCAMAKEMNPPLTTLLQDVIKMAEYSVDTLIDVIDTGATKNIRVPVKMVHRQSCGCDGIDNTLEDIKSLDIEEKLKEAQQNISAMKIAKVDELRKSWFIPFLMRELDGHAGHDREFCQKVVEGMKLSNAGDSYLYLFDTPLVCHDESEWSLPNDLKLAAYYRNGEYFAYETYERPSVEKDSMMSFMACEERKSYLVFLLFSGPVQYGLLACDVSFDDFGFYYMLSLQLGIALGHHEGRKRELAYQNKIMRDMEELVLASEFDPLTGVYNRRGLFKHAEKLFEKVARDAETYEDKDAAPKLHLIFADIDHLKQINDTFGHAEGDYAINSCADVLRSILRGGDIIARIGGDEFVCLVLVGGEQFEKYFGIRRANALEQLNKDKSKPYYVEFSYGMYSDEIHNKEELENAINKADASLYESKSKRRDSVLKEN